MLLEQRQSIQKTYFDRRAKSKPEIQPNSNVMVQNPTTKIWSPAKLVQRHETPRSYMVEDCTGRILRRNSHFIQPTLYNDKQEPEAEMIDKPPNQDPINETPAVKECSEGTNTTRSGRVVKPRKRLDL